MRLVASAPTSRSIVGAFLLRSRRLLSNLHQEFTDAVLGSMESSQDLSTQILNNPDIFQKLLAELVPIIYDELKKTA